MCLPFLAHVTETPFVKTTTFILMIVKGLVNLIYHQYIFSTSLYGDKLRTLPPWCSAMLGQSWVLCVTRSKNVQLASLSFFLGLSNINFWYKVYILNRGFWKDLLARSFSVFELECLQVKSSVSCRSVQQVAGSMTIDNMHQQKCTIAQIYNIENNTNSMTICNMQY